MSKHHLNEVLANPDLLESLKRRFHEKVRQGDPTECWPWTSKAVAHYGYGRMTAGRGRYLRAHQVAWALVNGPIPDNASVLHSCDNTACCNPAHLSIGSQQENLSGAKDRGRNSKPPHAYNVQHHNVKFSLEDAKAMKEDPRPARLVAKEYGVCEMTVYRHRRGTAWK